MSSGLYLNTVSENGHEYAETTVGAAPKIPKRNEKDKQEMRETTSQTQRLTGKLVVLLTILNIVVIIVIPALYIQSETKWKEALQLEIQKMEMKSTETSMRSVMELHRTITNDTAVIKAQIYRLQQKTNNDTASTTERECSTADPRSRKAGSQSYGVFEIYVKGHNVAVFCDYLTDNEDWTVIQRRIDGSVDFYRGYSDYKNGFGNLSGEFWIGLDNLHNILQSAYRFELRIDMGDWDGNIKYAKYSRFYVATSEDDYRLTVNGYSGTAGDSFSHHSGAKFSTKDNDMDTNSENCAQLYSGAWWYQTSCHRSNLNGLYLKGGHGSPFGKGINWEQWKGHEYSLKFVEMKIKQTQG